MMKVVILSIVILASLAQATCQEKASSTRSNTRPTDQGEDNPDFFGTEGDIDPDAGGTIRFEDTILTFDPYTSEERLTVRLKRVDYEPELNDAERVYLGSSEGAVVEVRILANGQPLESSKLLTPYTFTQLIVSEKPKEKIGMMIVTDPGSTSEKRFLVPSNGLTFGEEGLNFSGPSTLNVSAKLKVTNARVWIVAYAPNALDNLSTGKSDQISSQGTGGSTTSGSTTGESTSSSGGSGSGNASGITCPQNYIKIPFNTAVGTTVDFCVMKYEAKIKDVDNGQTPNIGNHQADSRQSGTPWTIVSQTAAKAACQALGPGYSLISNAQWQTIARNIETTQNASGVYLNWNTGNANINSFINQGNSNAVSNATLASGSDESPCHLITSKSNCTNKTHDDFVYKRTHTLSNGAIIWDFSGNASEWIRDLYTSGPEGSADYVTKSPWNDFGTKETWGPFGVFGAAPQPLYCGLGYSKFSPRNGLGAVARGGYFEEGLGYYAGIFAADITIETNSGFSNIGFRCVYEN